MFGTPQKTSPNAASTPSDSAAPKNSTLTKSVWSTAVSALAGTSERPPMFEIKIFHSEGDDRSKSLGMVETLEAGKELIFALDDRFTQWEVSGFPELPDDDVLRYFEGCDVSATDQTTKEIFYLEGTEDGDIWWNPNA